MRLAVRADVERLGGAYLGAPLCSGEVPEGRENLQAGFLLAAFVYAPSARGWGAV
jgi:hypothetical protein